MIPKPSPISFPQNLKNSLAAFYSYSLRSPRFSLLIYLAILFNNSV